jgi:UDP-glucose 4-epimerase
MRLFNTIGPRQTGQYGMVVPRFVKQALLGEPITVYGDGTQCRSFTWVKDVVGAMAKLIDNPGACGQVFNVGHTKEISVYDLALLIKDLTKSTSEIVYKPYEEVYEAGFEDMPRRLPDISKIQHLIGYQPTRDLGEMLESIIAHERLQLEAKV